MRKSSTRTQNYRAGFSRGHLHLASFRDQMSDYAKGEALRQLRASKRMSQEAVAFELGVSTKTVRSWEHSGGIRWENAQALGKFYDRAPESLVTRDLEEAGVPSRDQLDLIEGMVEALVVHFKVALPGPVADALALKGGPSVADWRPAATPETTERKPRRTGSRQAP